MKLRNKRRRYTLLSIGAVILICGGVAVWWLLRPVPHTSDGRLYIAEPTQRVTEGATVTFVVRADVAVAVNAVTATLAYDPAVLQFDSVTYATTSFDSSIPATHTDHTITLQSAKLGGATATGDVEIATVHFTAKKSTDATVRIQDGMAANAGLSIQLDHDNKGVK